MNETPKGVPAGVPVGPLLPGELPGGGHYNLKFPPVLMARAEQFRSLATPWVSHAS
jgi:hypothetical protein